MDGRPRGLALDGRARLRNTPTLFNVALSASFNWDGATNTLEAHADKLLSNPDVMNARWPELLAKLRADPGYRASFQAAYSDGLSRANLLDALASFERTLITPDAPFDRYLRGETAALTSEQLDGYRLFKSYGCVACHQGVNVGGNLFQKFGVFQEFVTTSASGDDTDSGRHSVTRVERDRGVFRVPSLRNVALTGPYFHDGSMPTLEGAVATMARVQLGRSLTQDDIRLIVCFLQTLTGEFRGQPLTIAASGTR